MCVGPSVRPFHFQVAVEHPSQGGMCLFDIQFYARLSPCLFIELMHLLSTHAFQERFLDFHQRVVEHLTPYATVRVDQNIEALEGEEIDEIMTEFSEEGEFYFLVPVGEHAWEHVSVKEDPLAERVQHLLYV
jgi:hypothetical protein